MDIYSVDGYVYRGNFGYTLTITYETLAPDITPGTTNVCVGFDPPAITPTGLGVTNMARMKCRIQLGRMGGGTLWL